MISDECVHKIELDNLENGEIIKHTVLLIKGHIRQQRQAKKCTEQQILLRVRHDASVLDATWELQMRSKISRTGQFKLLCDFGQHELETVYTQIPLILNFSYCNIVYQCKILYESISYSKNNYRLQALYITCVNQKPLVAEQVHENCEKINLNLRLVQSVYAEQLRSAGYGRITFILNSDCKVFESRLTCEEAWEQSEESLWQNFAKEILNSSTWGSENKLKFVAFIGCTIYDGAAVAATGDFSYSNIRKHLKGHAALGGGGLALFGAAYLYAWPKCFNEINACFGSNKLVDLTQLPDDSNYRRTYGGVYATTLGAVVHEIGHTFDLGHTKDGVMGNGFDYINRVFTIDNLTEHLPERVIERPLPELRTEITARPRFTQLKRATSTFLEKYHEQKTNDAFYFTRNCAIILAYNKWFGNSNGYDADKNTDDALITYDAGNNCVITEGHENPLCLMEVRSIDNSLVKYWYEPQSNKECSQIYKFYLPKEALKALGENHYLFVLTRSGTTKRLCEH
ncbi:uncharacterized protein [Bactrocera oleae]|uniref:uncharacterized protein n=1 Tax=Bactrocera oleae TaxID=104688 RepID=UPI0006B75D2F|nr:putative zinc metalloproteinase C607.06c [Bactrocera oleae]XP_036227600.1 putative zinc metalloproteinase C607.06c [Bactrocera oleae]XP_036227601.1 putative zinc metalloproteinase C607.06c [Bactrocera oleae]XP_036227602.1 putative zinc metalloproteinase C607.06c [Bactrocera oleae]